VGRFLPLIAALRQHIVMLRCMRRESAKSGHSPTVGEQMLILNGDIRRQLLVGMERFELQLC